jgi:hypothetical protein
MPIFVDFQSSITDELLKESAPLDSQAAVLFGDILKSRARELEAETYFRLAAEAGNPKGAVALGLQLQERGNSFEAITWLKKTGYYDSWYSRILLARALATTGSQQEAEEVLDSAIAAVNSNYSYHRSNASLGIYLPGAGNADDSYYRLNTSISWEYFYAGLIQKAIQSLELTYELAANPQYIAWLYILAGEEEKAMRWINDTRERGLTQFADMLEGDYFFAKRMYKEAVRSYSKVTSLNRFESEFDILVGLRIAQTYKEWGNLKEVNRWTSEEVELASYANTFAFSEWWDSSYDYHIGVIKLLVDDVMKRATELDFGNQSTNAMCNWGISDFRFGNLDLAIMKLESALNAPDKTSESEASFFLMHAYAELGRSEDSAEMKRRCDASGGYEPHEIDRKRLGLE